MCLNMEGRTLNNVVNFPHSGANHVRTSVSEIRNNLLAIAVYLDSIASLTPCEKWTRCMSGEVRRVCREMG